jgi:hypothetical protein
MKREFVQLKVSDKKHKYLCIDEENSEQIWAFLQNDDRRSKKFKYVIDIILNQKPTKDIFEKENISKEIDDVYAIKLFKGSDNIRFYCKTYEKDDLTFYIIIAELLEKKKSQKLTTKIKNIIKRVHDYEYEV